MGKIVFQSDNYQNNWGGENYAGGESLLEGTYFYIINPSDGSPSIWFYLFKEINVCNSLQLQSLLHG